MLLDSIHLATAETNVEYTVKNLEMSDNEIKEFLFSLGCYEGEKITLISKFSEQFVVSLKDARYSFDKELAEAILIEKI